MRTETFDTKCFLLADTFLDEVPEVKALHALQQEKVKDALAGEIQGVVEEFIQNIREEIKEVATP